MSIKRTTHKAEFFFTIPAKDDLAGWVRLLDEARWMDIEEMIHLHNMLHAVFGAEPNDAVLAGERDLSARLRAFGIEHRIQDALSDAAGTTVQEPSAPSLEELRWFLSNIPLHSGIIKLRQGVSVREPVIAMIDEQMLPEGTGKLILKQLNKMMPQGVQLKLPPKTPPDDFAREMSVYDLVLRATWRPDVNTLPWKKLVDSAPKLLLKSAEQGRTALQTPRATVLKSTVMLDDGDSQERFVLGPVLFPEKEDTQGEIYSHAEVLKACHWWAANSGVLSLRHVLQGGRMCSPDEMKTVENYCTLADMTVQKSDGSDEFIPMGTWMLGAMVYGPELCALVDAGEMGTWSIGAECLAAEEEVPAAN